MVKGRSQPPVHMRVMRLTQYSEWRGHLVHSCAPAWLTVHIVPQKCWKWETNSLIELPATDPDVFFPHILWIWCSNRKWERVWQRSNYLCNCDAAFQKVQKQTPGSGATFKRQASQHVLELQQITLLLFSLLHDKHLCRKLVRSVTQMNFAKAATAFK